MDPVVRIAEALERIAKALEGDPDRSDSPLERIASSLEATVEQGAVDVRVRGYIETYQGRP